MIKEKIIGIYGIHNNTEDKWYIGSSTDLETRLNAHIKAIKDRSGIFNGVPAECDFAHVILKKIKDAEYLELWENYFMGKYDSLDNGYNKKLSSRKPSIYTRKINVDIDGFEILGDEELMSFLKIDNVKELAEVKKGLPSYRFKGGTVRFEKATIINYLTDNCFYILKDK